MVVGPPWLSSEEREGSGVEGEIEFLEEEEEEVPHDNGGGRGGGGGIRCTTDSWDPDLFS